MERIGANSHSAPDAGRAAGPRHSILDLAPLELECLSALWPMGEGTVRDIHRQLSVARPRAYTTVLTIMDRLAQKGIVARRKVGRAYRYQANLSADEARWGAVEKIVAGFFDGSPEALAAHLSSNRASNRALHLASNRTEPLAAPAPPGETLRDFAPPVNTAAHTVIDEPDATGGESSSRSLDETLL